MMESKEDWIFYLKLNSKLNKSFIQLDQGFKDNGLTLIPVSVSDLIAVNRGDGNFKVVLIADGFAEAKYYHKKIRKILKYWMKSKRISLYIASSFKLLDDSAIYSMTGNYHYFELPIELSDFCDKISSSIKEKNSNSKKWPGASRRLGSTIG